jgi:hypothetical protein
MRSVPFIMVFALRVGPASGPRSNRAKAEKPENGAAASAIYMDLHRVSIWTITAASHLLAQISARVIGFPRYS